MGGSNSIDRIQLATLVENPTNQTKKPTAEGLVTFVLNRSTNAVRGNGYKG